MRLFKNAWFSRFAEKESISDVELKALADDIENGKIDANLGGGVYKQRIARTREGKSGGYRVILFFKAGSRVFFHYGFSKSNKDNIGKLELRTYKKLAKTYMKMSEEQLNRAVTDFKLIEIRN